VDATEVAQLKAAFVRRIPLLNGAATELERLARVGLGGYEHKHIDRVGFRVKDVDSFVEKVVKRGAKPAYTDALAQVEDQIGGRVIVLFKHDIDPIVSLLLQTFTKMELEHRVPAADAEFGYESTHLVCHIAPPVRPKGWADEPSMPTTFELQVRTVFMHAYAEPNHNLGYKAAADLTRDHKRRLAWIAASAWGADEALDNSWRDIGQPNQAAAEKAV
jgi:putative GTP pyrophosphokinase